MASLPLNMFPAGEDLPLFSGVAPRGTWDVFDPSSVGHQMMLAGGMECKLCFDTGLVQAEKGKIRFCWCKAGQKAKAKEGK